MHMSVLITLVQLSFNLINKFDVSGISLQWNRPGLPGQSNADKNKNIDSNGIAASGKCWTITLYLFTKHITFLHSEQFMTQNSSYHLKHMKHKEKGTWNKANCVSLGLWHDERVLVRFVAVCTNPVASSCQSLHMHTKTKWFPLNNQFSVPPPQHSHSMTKRSPTACPALPPSHFQDTQYLVGTLLSLSCQTLPMPAMQLRIWIAFSPTCLQFGKQDQLAGGYNLGTLHSSRCVCGEKCSLSLMPCKTG